MIINLLSTCQKFNDYLFCGLNNSINALSIPDFLKDALIDSTNLIPFLLLIFILIELLEVYLGNKFEHISKYSQKFGPLFGAMLAGLPQCGFSVLATPLYIKGLISKGTLIAIYVSTSDEAIPILLSSPEEMGKVLPLLTIKVILGIISGYLIDLLFPQRQIVEQSTTSLDTDENGCCSHKILPTNIKDIILHPLKHTLNVFILIFLISLGLNYLLCTFGNDFLNTILLNHSIFQQIMCAIIGLIPNCGISVILTMLYIGGILSFPSVISGLTSSAGLGLIVLFKRNTSLKDSLSIVGLLLGISVISGFILSFLNIF
jgi:hypothetical protein